jgi:transcriptional regulator with GAF, ATPase, and Fis domain
VPHDEADLAVLTPDGAKVKFYATTDDAAIEFRWIDGAISRGRQPRLLDVIPGPERGLRSGVSVPVRIDDRLVGVFALFSRQPHAYLEHDLAQAERLARYLAVPLGQQRLAEEARDAAVERERAANIETSMELLRAIADVLDIRTVFSRVSEIANKMLPHDAMTMNFVDPKGDTVREAAAGDVPELPGPSRLTVPTTHELILPDLSVAEMPETADVCAALVHAGFRSALSVGAYARSQAISVAFLSKQLDAFHARDLSVARRIVDHIALAVSHEQLADAARQIAETRARADRLEARVQMLSDELESKSQLRVIGDSAQWRDVLKKATQVAATDTTVLLTGESGTGKEVVARFIHRASPRSQGPFVALNCAALPEQLLESELFGYERGAFTSAHQAKPGQIELAAGGVLFLDEVSEMSLSAQAKFLRVLQEHEFQRLGATRMLKANIRVVAATNRDLRKAVERGTFRDDLFYRLQVFDIHIAPLRDRPEDILPLSEAFLKNIGKSFGRPPAGLTRDAREALLRHDWPGNVRELHNALERAAILCEGGLIHAGHLSLESVTRTSEQPTADLSATERDTIAQVLQDTKWNKAKAAKRLGLSRTQLYNRMRKYGLE